MEHECYVGTNRKDDGHYTMKEYSNTKEILGLDRFYYCPLCGSKIDWYKNKRFNLKYFGKSENEAVDRIIKKNAVEKKENFFDYYK